VLVDGESLNAVLMYAVKCFGDWGSS